MKKLNINTKNLNKDEKNVVDFLKKEYNAKAIIFVGSRATGDFKKNSDWDIWVFTNKKNTRLSYKMKEKYGMEDYDLDLYFASPKQKFTWKKFGIKFRFHKIVYDPYGIAKEIVKKALKEYSKGPEKWTKQYALNRIEKVKRYENKFNDLINEKNYPELYKRLADHFLENTYVWWYGVRGEWVPRPQQMFDDLKKRDKKFYNYIKRFSSDNTTQKQRVKIIKNLHRYFFNSKAYRNITGKEADKKIKQELGN